MTNKKTPNSQNEDTPLNLFWLVNFERLGKGEGLNGTQMNFVPFQVMCGLYCKDNMGDYTVMETVAIVLAVALLVYYYSSARKL